VNGFKVLKKIKKPLLRSISNTKKKNYIYFDDRFILKTNKHKE